MKYTEEKLLSYPVKTLVKIILDQQSELGLTNEKLSAYKDFYETIMEKAMAIEKSQHSTMMAGETVICEDAPSKGKVGRKPATPEQRLEAYERQKARQREKYAEMKKFQKEQDK